MADDAMLDQDGMPEDGLATDGSQPEFDFDDIEQPAPVAAVREAAPVVESGAVDPERQEAAIRVPSPAVAAVAAIEAAVGPVEAAPVVQVVAQAPAEPMIEVALEAPQPVAVEAPQPVAFEAPQAVAVEAPPVVAGEAVADVAPTPDVVVEPAVAAIEVAQPEPADAVVVPAAAIEQDVVAEATADPAASRAEQLRGLFDTARQDAASPSLPAQEDAAEQATRNA